MKNYFSDLPQQYNSVQEVEVSENADAVVALANIELELIKGAVDITKETIRCFTEYAECKEREKTERKRIIATLKAIEYQIDAKKEIYLRELDKQYEERNRIYDMVEKDKEIALRLGDKEMLQICYNFILNIYEKPIDIDKIAISNEMINIEKY